MRINKLIATVILLALGWFACIAAFAAGDPVSMLNSVANSMISGLRSNEASLKSKPQIVYSLANRYVVPNADLDQMARSVLPPHVWTSATPAQRAQFKKEFTMTLIRTYASALSSYRDQTVKFFPVRGGTAGKRTLEVNSQIISSEHDPINVSYRVINVGGAWKLVDLSVEGVSMLQSFRSQFGDMLTQGNMDQLLARMSSHNNRSMD